jgi:hypothetical protein
VLSVVGYVGLPVTLGLVLLAGLAVHIVLAMRRHPH